MVDLLPRVRYLLRVHPATTNECAAPLWLAFFTHGLLVLPEEGVDGLVRRVVALNLSEKAIRAQAGRELAGDEVPTPDATPSHGGSPLLVARAAPQEGASEGGSGGGSPSFYLGCSIQPPPHSEKRSRPPESERVRS